MVFGREPQRGGRSIPPTGMTTLKGKGELHTDKHELIDLGRKTVTKRAETGDSCTKYYDMGVNLGKRLTYLA